MLQFTDDRKYRQPKHGEIGHCIIFSVKNSRIKSLPTTFLYCFYMGKFKDGSDYFFTKVVKLPAFRTQGNAHVHTASTTTSLRGIKPLGSKYEVGLSRSLLYCTHVDCHTSSIPRFRQQNSAAASIRINTSSSCCHHSEYSVVRTKENKIQKTQSNDLLTIFISRFLIPTKQEHLLFFSN